jgi:hypothetical protein
VVLNAENAKTSFNFLVIKGNASPAVESANALYANQHQLVLYAKTASKLKMDSVLQYAKSQIVQHAKVKQFARYAVKEQYFQRVKLAAFTTVGYLDV